MRCSRCTRCDKLFDAFVTSAPADCPPGDSCRAQGNAEHVAGVERQMNLVWWLLGALGSAVFGVVLFILLEDQVRDRLGFIVRLLNPWQKPGIEGSWVATFTIERDGSTEEYTEVIQLKRAIGRVVGRIVPDQRNYVAISQVAARRPLRVIGEFVDSRYFTGMWFHPLERSRFHGAFQLLLHPSGASMDGRWIGFSESLVQIDSGMWHWERR